MLRDDVVYLGSTGWRLTCLQCGGDFTAKRRDAKFCPGGRCRKAAARRKEEIIRAQNAALGHISTIRLLMARYSDLEMVGALALDAIEAALQQAIIAPSRPAAAASAEISETLAGRTDNKNCIICGQSLTGSPSAFLCKKHLPGNDL